VRRTKQCGALDEKQRGWVDEVGIESNCADVGQSDQLRGTLVD
jgi:hypothetical protein